MKPEEFNGEESVKQFYEKLQIQIEQLEQLVKATGKEESNLAKNISTVKVIDNHISFTYFQKEKKKMTRSGCHLPYINHFLKLSRLP